MTIFKLHVALQLFSAFSFFMLCVMTSNTQRAWNRSFLKIEQPILKKILLPPCSHDYALSEIYLDDNSPLGLSTETGIAVFDLLRWTLLTEAYISRGSDCFLDSGVFPGTTGVNRINKNYQN